MDETPQDPAIFAINFHLSPLIPYDMRTYDLALMSALSCRVRSGGSRDASMPVDDARFRTFPHAPLGTSPPLTTSTIVAPPIVPSVGTGP